MEQQSSGFPLVRNLQTLNLNVVSKLGFSGSLAWSPYKGHLKVSICSQWILINGNEAHIALIESYSRF